MVLQLRRGMRGAVTRRPGGIPRRGLVARWQLGNADAANYVDSQTVADLSGNGHTLLRGKTSSVETSDFTPQDAYADFATDDYGRSSVNPTAEGSIICVFKASSTGVAQTLVGSFSGLNGGTYVRMEINSQSPPHLDMQIGSSAIGVTALSAGQWYVGASTWSPSAMQVYLDGTLDKTGTPTLSALNGSPFCVGVTGSGGLAAGNFLNSSVAEVLIYNVVLTNAELKRATQVLQAYYAPKIPAVFLDSPAAFQILQRNGTDVADIAIAGRYMGTPTGIEARYNDGEWTALNSSDSRTGIFRGSFSGTLSSQAAGQGSVEVRFTNDASVTDSATNIGIGDVYIIGGQSNASGRGTNNQTYSNATLKAGLFGNDYQWKELTDPTDSNAGTVDTVSSESVTPGGSVWPLLATELMASTGYPVAFVPCALGGSAIASWLPGGNHQDRSTLYGSMIYRALQTGAKAVLWWQGETDAQNGVNQATYNSCLDTLANSIAADIDVRIMPCKLQNSSIIPDAQESVINAAIGEAWVDNDNVLTGPDLSDLTSDDDYHLKTDAHLQTAADRWFSALDNAGLA